MSDFLELCAVCEALLGLCKKQEEALVMHGITGLEEERAKAYAKYEELMGKEDWENGRQ